MSYKQVIKKYDESLDELKKAQLSPKKNKKDVDKIESLSEECTECGYLVSLVKKAQKVGLNEEQIKLLAKNC